MSAGGKAGSHRAVRTGGFTNSRNGHLTGLVVDAYLSRLSRKIQSLGSLATQTPSYRCQLPPLSPKNMIGKSGHRFSLATNAKRLRGDHAQTISQSDDDSSRTHCALGTGRDWP